MKGRFKSKWFACLHFVKEKRKKSAPVDMIIADNLFTPRGSLVLDNPEGAESSDTDSNSNKSHIGIAYNPDASTSSSSDYNDEPCLTKKAEIPQLQLNNKKKKCSSNKKILGKGSLWKNNEKKYIEEFQRSESSSPNTPCSDTTQSSPLSSPTTPTPGSSKKQKNKIKLNKIGLN
jgi:hypothetical protein